MIVRIFLSLFILVLIFTGILLIRTFTFSAEKLEVDPVQAIEVPDIAIERLSKAITFPTISYLEAEKLDTAAFLGFHRYLKESYPSLDSVLEKKVFNYSLLYKWKGSDPSAKSVVMMGHFDVVPVDESTMDKWEADPFSGKVIDGKIVGRGALDDKENVMALMETAEILVKEGFQPRRDIYFSFGHDEEVGGDKGARLIAEHLGKNEVDIEFVIDEGGFLTEDLFPGIDKPVAIINTAEKGFVSYKLTIKTPGGHSSAPPEDNTIGSLAQAIVKLEANQFEYRMLPVIKEQINIIGPQLNDFIPKMAMANTWLFSSQILKEYNAHTTTVATMIEGGVKDNVIPTEASVVVNFRLIPGETSESVRQHIKDVVQDDRISIEAISNINEPSPQSDTDSESYRLIEKTILQLFPDAIVGPGLLGGGTDSKHFIPYAENVYRFYPIRFRPEMISMAHGNNEQISIDNYKEIIQFNYQLIKNLQ